PERKEGQRHGRQGYCPEPHPRKAGGPLPECVPGKCPRNPRCGVQGRAFLWPPHVSVKLISGCCRLYLFLTGCSLSTGAEVKAVLPKKEKLRLRRERWLQKIEAIKLAEQKRREERRRRATVVVGDLHPLRDALPTLQELGAPSQPHTRGRQSSKPRPAELSRMSAAQRQQLLEEERTRFQELLASPAYRASPLLAIGQQLAHQLQLESSSQL
uniref:Family with sequence similarity 207 member A n=1 Tax=Oryctolagus cuniculus TaxID=9986 RepID=G1U6E3_RABIT